MELIRSFGKIGGNYPEVYDRLHDKALIEDRLRMFLTDKSYSALKKAAESGTGEEIKEAAHSLGDVARLLALSDLYYRLSSMETAADSPECGINCLKEKMQGISELYDNIYSSIANCFHRDRS